MDDPCSVCHYEPCQCSSPQFLRVSPGGPSVPLKFSAGLPPAEAGPYLLTALIMAGGSGERFWPLSTPTKPKQLLNLFSEKSMIRETVDRILPLLAPERIFIATNVLQAEEIKKELPDIPIENIIIEPAFKVDFICLVPF